MSACVGAINFMVPWIATLELHASVALFCLMFPKLFGADVFLHLLLALRPHLLLCYIADCPSRRVFFGTAHHDQGILHFLESMETLS